jgi:hypothetical protein
VSEKERGRTLRRGPLHRSPFKRLPSSIRFTSR